jgi:hypothetical protein
MRAKVPDQGKSDKAESTQPEFRGLALGGIPSACCFVLSEPEGRHSKHDRVFDHPAGATAKSSWPMFLANPRHTGRVNVR